MPLNRGTPSDYAPYVSSPNKKFHGGVLPRGQPPSYEDVWNEDMGPVAAERVRRVTQLDPVRFVEPQPGRAERRRRDMAPVMAALGQTNVMQTTILGNAGATQKMLKAIFIMSIVIIAVVVLLLIFGAIILAQTAKGYTKDPDVVAAKASLYAPAKSSVVAPTSLLANAKNVPEIQQNTTAVLENLVANFKVVDPILLMRVRASEYQRLKEGRPI